MELIDEGGHYTYFAFKFYFPSMANNFNMLPKNFYVIYTATMKFLLLHKYLKCLKIK